MTQKKANFVPVSALDKRPPSKRDLLRGLVRQAPFVAKNFHLYFRNGWRRHVLRTKVVAPYAVTFYVTHKCNLAAVIAHKKSRRSSARSCRPKRRSSAASASRLTTRRRSWAAHGASRSAR